MTAGSHKLSRMNMTKVTFFVSDHYNFKFLSMLLELSSKIFRQSISKSEDLCLKLW